MNTNSPFKFYEFFCGGGMARAGLGNGWDCLFSNDFDHKKSSAYAKNWGSSELKTADVKTIRTSDLPANSDLVWASFPCQDLSLAGGGAGLKGERSGTFWPFWDLMNGMIGEDRAPKMIVLENVCGTLTSHKGEDFKAICKALSKSGYNFGAVVVDAALFIPHSRPRLFVIAVKEDQEIVSSLTSSSPVEPWHTKAVQTAYSRLPNAVARKWIWWNLAIPAARSVQLEELVEEDPDSVVWHTAKETKKLLSMMSQKNLEKVKEAKKLQKKVVGTIYKRTRLNEAGCKVQRAEVRFDGLAGCLRTPAGGSSRQLIIVIEGNKVRSRLISSRETARLMGLSDDYSLPEKYNEAYHLTGDGVVVPVVRHLAEHIFEPIILQNSQKSREAA